MLVVSSGVENLAAIVIELKNNKKISEQVENRITEFLSINEKDTYAWFTELAYCILTAYSSAENGQLCVDALCDCGALLDGSLDEVIDVLKVQGHRFANRRAEYIITARSIAPTLKKTIQQFDNTNSARKWLVEEVKGLGWKESSHFLRNIGYLNVAIIDRHIISNLIEFNLIPDQSRKGLTKRRYLEYERILLEIAKMAGLKMGEMDLYLWYRKTGKVLK